MDLGLTGKTALIAGASSGLGFAVAQALAAEGANVCLMARDEARLLAARDAIAQGSVGRVTHHAADITDRDAVRNCVQAVATEFGALHIAIANAGSPPAGPSDSFALEEYRQAFDLSVLALIGLGQATLPHMVAAGWGRLIFITSEAVLGPLAGYALSSTVRLAVVGYARTLVDELGSCGVTVNVLAPGYHDTPLTRSSIDQEGRNWLAEHAIPMGRFGDASDFGAAAAFLASERASFISGAILPVHGGGTRR